MKTRWYALALAAFTFLITLSTANAQSDNKVYRLDSLTTDITVQTNGNMNIVETQQYTYVSGAFKGYGFRDIDLGRFDDITNVVVTENNKAYTPSQGETPNTYYTTQDDTQFHIIWWYTKPKIPSTRIFQLAYTVEGGLRYYAGGDQVWWRSVFPTHYVNIPLTKTTVHLPPGVPADQIKIESYRNANLDSNGTKQIVDPQTIVFTSNNVPDGTFIEVRVQFPHGIVQGTKSQWQDQFDADQHGKHRSWLIAQARFPRCRCTQ